MDIHPKSLRIAFEKGSTDYLHKKYTKDRFREDPEYYNKVLAEQRRKLLEKRDKISGILKKKLAWGSIDTLGGSALACLSVLSFGACGDFVHSFGKEREAGAAFVAGCGLFTLSSGCLWYGGKKIWNNYSSDRVTKRLERHDAADQQVRNYLDEVFGTKESDDVKSS